jgi:hypothetical protein
MISCFIHSLWNWCSGTWKVFVLLNIECVIQYCDSANISLQETHLCASSSPHLFGVTPHHYGHRDIDSSNGGGTAFLLRDCIYSDPVTLQCSLPVIAFCWNLPICSFTSCNIYFISASLIAHAAVTCPIHSLDFSTRNILWGSVHSDKRGRIVCNVMLGSISFF